MQTLLSEHWHAVRFLRPRLRAGVQVLHRFLRGKAWVLLFDPISQRFHRATPHVYRILLLLDGQRTLEEVWSTACEHDSSAAMGVDHEAAISQHELVQLISTLHASDLLQTQISPDATEVFERYSRQERARFKQAWLNPLSVKVPLLYPDAWFERRTAAARRIFSWTMLWIWILVVAPAAVLAWQHWAALSENLSDRVLSGSNIFLLWLIYPLVKGVHEWAHGMAVKAWGGTVREIGVIFVIFTPVPYVDATSSYLFPSKWARAAVSAAGILAELLLGALAVYAWLLSESGLFTAVAFNIILIAFTSTFLVNGNPLMRFDGYFILCDLLETPNLAQRSGQYWVYLLDRYFFGASDAQPPMGSEQESRLLIFYGLASPIYRFLIVISLIFFVGSEYLLVGAVLALVAAWSAFVMPVWKGWTHLRHAPSLARRRDMATRRTVAALLVAAGLLFLVPLPFYSVQQAVVWLPDEAIVRSMTDGHIVKALIQPNQTVATHDVVLLLENQPLQLQREVAEAGVHRLQAQLRKAEVDAPVRAEAIRSELVARNALLTDLQWRVDHLAVAAEAAGQWKPAAPTELPGRYVKRGEILGFIVGPASSLVRVAVPQEDMDLIQSRLRRVDVRLANDPQTPIEAHVRRQVTGGEFTLVSAALGTNGGGDIAVDPISKNGTRSLRRIFDMEVELSEASRTRVFGDRAYVRFYLDWTPLGLQWILRLRQLFLARLNV